ncbi:MULTISPECIES: replication initiation negative regulator SeqA [unclassified Arsukibacterium]|uniref:replication initiation negative regulator SeqA n=1 Tax=unclassified Arsukibacterium TaxID=2635278 RepID=UPI000C3943D2|nr:MULTISPECIES: replication initiation negative regulator SeqA [unclassified Arsukibacterium]MAA93565.1 replication initiation negative regulator SeqA [Rheinheimera sp.]MBM33407.1 replication initiation negative regulator SeqA [Rheinheimera sp.]HAW92554.1 replication initiation negative regulator SeqA [Candidatus Azambacteria bacterium]|tara:strand:- start:29966 stop:30505 length:540 start_codon:yes stop_codon:yes gene_type:complete
MKTIEIEDDLYHYIATQTRQIGESASDILRRLLLGEQVASQTSADVAKPETVEVEPLKPAVTLETANPGTVFDLVSRQDLQAESSVVGRFLYLLSVLARVHKKQFGKVLDIKGRNRLYFATTAEALSEAGSSTNPKQIPNTTFWVITNSNTTRKKMMLTETAIKLGYSEQDAERIRDLL